MANAVNPLRKAKTTARDTRPISHGHPWPPIHYEPDSGINALRNSGRLATFTRPLGQAPMATLDILGTTECTECALKARAGIHSSAQSSALHRAPTVDKRLDFIIRASKAVSYRTNHHDGCIGPEARPLHRNPSGPRSGNAAKEREDLENGYLQAKGPPSLYPDPS
jgi:hypothetical protein